jgi:adenine-specific DNA-methyltransferase
MPHTKLRPHFTFDEERLKELRKIAPEAFVDGQVNWETLKEAFGEYVEAEGPDSEHFGLFWPGKKDARKIASIPSKGTLMPVNDNGSTATKWRNVFIEGENLEVLKLLQKSYASKIKAIYIDPPYNTGNDFIYEDDFKEPLEEYLKRTGQVDEEGAVLTTNPKSDGRFHSNWLSMIYPRLRLARNLLRDDGVIFVSIDDNEVHNLRAVMNEIFGEENFIDCIIWKKRYGGGAKEKYLVSVHEYILFYAKNIFDINSIYVPLDEKSIQRYYKQKDSNYEKRGPFRTHPLEATKSVGKRHNLVFPIIAPDGTKVMPKRQWWWDKDRVEDAQKRGELDFVKSKDGSWSVHTKQYLKEENGEQRKTKSFSIIDEVYTQHGTNEIEELFGDSRVFSFPKPSKLISKLLDLADLKTDDIVLDFFSGSGSTAQAVLEKISENLLVKFVGVQIDQPVNKDEYAYSLGYKVISDVTKARIKKVVEKKYSKSKLRDEMNFGFFKLASSNFKQWKNYEGQSVVELEKQFELFAIPLVDDWSHDKLLSEVILIEGFPLDSAVERKKELKKNHVNEVNSNFCEHRLLVCLDKTIQPETISSLELKDEDIFICLDSAISDEEKVRLSDKGFLKTI